MLNNPLMYCKGGGCTDERMCGDSICQIREFEECSQDCVPNQHTFIIGEYTQGDSIDISVDGIPYHIEIIHVFVDTSVGFKVTRMTDSRSRSFFFFITFPNADFYCHSDTLLQISVCVSSFIDTDPRSFNFGILPYAPMCGNGKVEYGESCDDGNTINGDGCGWEGKCKHYIEFAPSDEIYLTQTQKHGLPSIRFDVVKGSNSGKVFYFDYLLPEDITSGLFAENIGETYSIFIAPLSEFSRWEIQDIVGENNIPKDYLGSPMPVIRIGGFDKVKYTRIYNRDLTELPNLPRGVSSVLDIEQEYDFLKLNDQFLLNQENRHGFKIRNGRYPSSGTLYYAFQHDSGLIVSGPISSGEDARSELRRRFAFPIATLEGNDATVTADVVVDALQAIPEKLYPFLKGIRTMDAGWMLWADYNVGAGINSDWNPEPHVFSGDDQMVQYNDFGASRYVLVHEFGHVLDVHYFVDEADNEYYHPPYNFEHYKLAYSPPWERLDTSSTFYDFSFLSPTFFNLNNNNVVNNAGDFVSGYAGTNEYEDFAETFYEYLLDCPRFKSRLLDSDVLRSKYNFFRDEMFDGEECDVVRPASLQRAVMAAPTEQLTEEQKNVKR